MLKRERGVYGMALLAVVLISSLSSCVFGKSNDFACDCKNCPCPPTWASAWQEQSNQGFASGPAGTFALRLIEITPQQYRFYYIFKSAQHAGLRVAVTSSLPANPTAQPVELAASVQTLGQIGDYMIGVIHVTINNRAGQIVTLEITPSLAGTATWRLAPLKQVAPTSPPIRAHVRFNVTPEGLPEAQWQYADPPVQYMSYVKMALPAQPIADRTYVFFQYDDPVVVKVLTKAQYIAIAGSANFTP